MPSGYAIHTISGYAIDNAIRLCYRVRYIIAIEYGVRHAKHMLSDTVCDKKT